MMLLMLFVGVQTVQANDEFEYDHNFMITRQGEASLHFRMLAWSHGKMNDWAYDYKLTTIYVQRYKLDKDGKVETVGPKQEVAKYHGYNGDNHNKVWFDLKSGTANITNTAELLGSYTVEKDAQGKNITLNSNDKFTFLEFDWYPEQDMLVYGDKKENVSLAFSMEIYYENVFTHYGPINLNKDSWKFDLSSANHSVTLTEPVFYPSGNSGSAGKIAIPYSVPNRPVHYTTSLDKSKVINLSAQTGMFYVDAADTCFGSFTVDMEVLRNDDSGLKWNVSSNAVTIPAYHRIHNFKVSEYVPTSGVTKDFYTGAKLLTWEVHHADEPDIMVDDAFIIERAYKSDFSDAEQVESVLYLPKYSDLSKGKGETEFDDTQRYSYVDNSVEAWVNKLNPELPVYYRVRRASSEYWGWDHDWAAKDSIAKPVYLAAPSRNIPVQVVKSDDFEQNRQIQVIISLDASCVAAIAKHEVNNKDEYENIIRNLVWNKTATLNLVRHMSHEKGGEDTEAVKIPVPASDINYDPVGKCWKAVVYDTPKFPCTYYRYSVEVETNFNTNLPKMTEEDRKNIIPPVMEGSTGDYLVDVSGVTAVPNYSSLDDINTDNFYFNEAAKVSNLQASYDTYNDHVALTWENKAGECDYYIIKRKSVLGGETEVLTPKSDSDLLSDCFYNDTTAIGGEEYIYSVQSVLHCENSSVVISDTVNVTGKANREAHIFGKLYYTNGMAVAGQKVVYAYGNDQKVAVRDTVTTNADGSYEIVIKDRPTEKDGEVKVTVSVSTENGDYEFKLPGQDGKDREVTISDTHFNIYDCDFASSKYLKFTGRVLYEGTSVPVSGASFLISGKVAKNKEGKNVITDSQGNFEITVPKGLTFTLQAVKDKHKFVDDGFFMVTDATDKLTNKLNFSENQYEKYFWDKTKVKLIGRVVGGDDQGNKPLGLDRSKNNLGDDLQLVFALEGNDVAHLVYNPEDRNEKVRDTTIVHADGIHKTKARFEAKRIVVNPDSLSGEYVLELLPEKYKVIQATAKGYSTLFAKEIGAAVVDMTNKLDTLYTGENEEDCISYNEQFKVIYHAPVQLTYQQTNFGRTLEYFGEEKLALSDFNKETTYVKVANVEKDGSVSYTFGHPVFNGITFSSSNKNKYAFVLSAHEDYYYNNDKQASAPDVVYMKGGKVKVSNGFDIKPDSKNEYVQLDGKGKGVANVTVYNPTFKLTGEDALRTLLFSMDYNGETVLSEPLQAFITGAKEMGSDVIGTKIDVLDVLRDPPGSASYSWIEEGTTYSSSYAVDMNFAAGVNFQTDYGSKTTTITGIIEGQSALQAIQGSVGKVMSLPFDFVYSDKNKNSYSYTFTTNKRIQTSSSESYVGNMGNVYIGTEIQTLLNRYETISVIDDSTRQRVAGAIKAGEVKILASGENEAGEPVHLVVSHQMSFTSGPTSDFAHTQKHIIKNILPELKATRDALLLIGDAETIQQMADQSGKVLYRSKVNDPNDINFGSDTTYYEIHAPKGMDKYDQIAEFNNRIASWMNAIIRNERITLEAFYNANKIDGVTVSAGTSIQKTESANTSYSYSTPSVEGNVASSAIKMGSTFASKLLSYTQQKWKASNGDNPFVLYDPKQMTVEYEDIFGLAKTVTSVQEGVSKQDQIKKKYNDQITHCEFGGVKFEFKYTPVFNFSQTENGDYSKKGTRTVGYKIEEGSHGHISVGVYRTPKSIRTLRKGDEYYMPVNMPNDSIRGSDIIDLIAKTNTTFYLPTENSGETMTFKDEDFLPADFVFIRYGGATRCPYEDAEYTYFYQPGTKISNATLKIDDPHIQVTNPVISDVPEDQPAVFDIVFSNDSEAPDADGYVIDKTFNFNIDSSTNPDGAKFYLDGYPLANGISLVIPRGQAVHKKLEMYRGTADDYENINLLFYTSCEFGNGVSTKISAHFQPTSTPLNLSSPTEKWVMNTLSPQNEGKFYIPVKIDGFNTEYRNFDHIELQYKRTTQPDADYVNICSFYADSTLFANASGEKRLIKGGVIDDLYFYGENDPMEQNYDLRAVSFCRLGNGFVTRASKVLSGVKDTRRPEVFGSVSPKTGVLGIGDYIGIPFSENIAGNHLDKTTSFEVMGYTNKTGIVNSTALLFDGGKNSCAKTEVSRNLSNKDFTIDLMVLPDAKSINKKMTFFTQGNESSYIVFGSDTLQNDTSACLFFSMTMNGKTKVVKSNKTYTDCKEWSRVSAVYEKNGNVTLYKDDTVLGSDSLFSGYDGVGKLIYGCDQNGNTSYSGKMLEARVWTKALSNTELLSTNLVNLTGYERKLLAYYPMNDGKGTLLEDKANGATLDVKGLSWSFPLGRSLHFEGNKGVLLDESAFARSSSSSYMLGLWFKTDTELKDSDNIMALYAEGDGTKNTKGLFVGIENKQLKVAQNGFSAKAVGDYADGNWHHVVLGVDRTNNKATVNVDGNKVMQFAADSLGALGINTLTLGSYRKKESGKDPQDIYCLKGYIDDVMLWQTVMSNDYMKHFDNSAPNGGELGLMVNLPFSTANSYVNGSIYNDYDGRNHLVKKERNAAIADKLIVLSDFAEEMSTTSSYAPVRDKDLISTLKFSYASKDNELVINLNVDDAEINKQNVFITVYDVEDMAGNTIESPVNMTLFIDRNQLKWEQKYVSRELSSGENDEFTVDIHNHGGSELNYTIQDIPDWLVVDRTDGSLSPTDIRPVKFKVKNNLNAGEHSSLIYLTDENGLYEPLLVTVTVRADAPDWYVNKSLFSETMSVVGTVKVIDNGSEVIDSDKDDLVGAFIDNECVGVQNIDYSESDLSSLYMTIYGNDRLTYEKYKEMLADNDDFMDVYRKKIVFRLWRSKTGQISELSLKLDGKDAEIVFRPDSIIGSPTNPVLMTTMQRSTQILSLNSGWNWVSFNIATDTGKRHFTEAIANKFEFSDGDIVKGRNSFSQYLTDTGWAGDLNLFDHHYCYMFNLEKGGYLEVFGNELNESNNAIKLRKGWNNLPYFGKHVVSVKNAMANFDAAQEGDIIKSYTEFAIYDKKNEKWTGSLKDLHPGQGYMIYCHNVPAGGLTFRFPTKEYFDGVNSAAPRRTFVGEHSGNMTVVAEALMSDGTKAMQGDVLQAYCGSELVGEAVADNEGKFYLMTSAENGDAISFRITRGSDDSEATTTPILGFDEATGIGTLKEPFVVDFRNSKAGAYPNPFTDVITFSAVSNPGDVVSIHVFDTAGSMVFSYEDTAASSHFEYTTNKLASLTQGIYIARITVGGVEKAVKIVKK